jgi:hypothetical protein
MVILDMAAKQGFFEEEALGFQNHAGLRCARDVFQKILLVMVLK